ncbi:MAG: sigma-54-dependent Fis family transcriptional regulator [Deltaproteobacteria bacterium]|nr:sigma-54-dependent Fis family transcriptional regulator [Deltaproteobacteria bacterium]
MITYSIYIVDDEETIRDGVSMALAPDYHVEVFPTAEFAIQAMKDEPPDLVLLDIGLPGMNGIDALGKMKALYPNLLIVMITAYEDIHTVISAMKLGAYDYVVKPLHMDSLKLTIGNALETIRLRKEVQALQEQYLNENLPFFVGRSDAIQDVMAVVNKVAKSPDTPILILGETGTGKELLASAIHYRSPNFKGPFIIVNCAAIPRDLIESELFGYEKGALSGARATGKKGLIEASKDGTLFLDEVGDMSLEAQAKLLRFIENREFYRVGGTKKNEIRTRLVSATNKNLESMIEKDQFRNDLYYRLGVIQIQVPSLNERSGDVLPMARHFLSEFSRKFSNRFTGISPRAERVLVSHEWKGNVRELKNVIERAVLIGKGPILEVEDLGMEDDHKAETSRHDMNGFLFPPLQTEGADLDATIRSLERHYIDEAFKMAEGNESKAARLLKMNHHTFRYRKKRLQEK